MSAEHPADQSVDKSACRPGETARNPREGSPLLKGGREKGGGFLADLFSFPTDRRPEAKINGLNLYESMSRRYGNQTRSPSRGSAAIYENCLKCVAARCRPSPRVAPADMFESVLAKSREHEAVANQEPRCQISGEEPQSEDRPHGEGKGPLQSFCASFGASPYPPLCFESCLSSFSSIINTFLLASIAFIDCFSLDRFCVGRKKVGKMGIMRRLNH